VSAQSDFEIERLCEALDTLVIREPRLAECVDLKFFCGFSFCDIAELARTQGPDGNHDSKAAGQRNSARWS